MPCLALPLVALLAAVPALAAPPPAAPPEPGLAGAGAGAVRVPSAPDAWGGPRTGREPTLSDRVADYSIRAVLDPVRHTVEGQERIAWRNRSAVPVGSIYLHLYLNAFASEGSTYMREKALHGAARTEVRTGAGDWGHAELRSVTQGGRPATWTFVHPDGGPATDETVVRVDLPEPVPPGGRTTLDVEFHDRLPRVVERSGWFGSFHMVGQWYPKIGVLELPGERGATRPRWNCHEYHLFTEFYADFGAYDLEVVVPEGFRVAAAGIPVGSPQAVAGGVSHRFRAEDVHDVAFAAWDGFAPPLTGTWTAPDGRTVAVEVLHPPEFRRGAEETLRATIDALEYFSRTLGPYPYPRVTAVLPPHNAGEAGGMEYETLFTGATTNRFPLDAVGVERYVTVHEFGHGYFMGILASNEAEEPWLDEGLNEYWDIRMLGGQPFRLRLPAPLRWLGVDLPGVDPWDAERGGATVRNAADPVTASALRRWSGGSYFYTYPRTAVAMHDLEAALGGDVLSRGMRLYYERWKFRHPSTADFREALLDAGAARGTVDLWFETLLGGTRPVDDRVVEVSAAEVLPVAGWQLRDGKREEVDEEAVRRQVREARAAWEKEHGKPRVEAPGPFPWRSTVTARRLGAHRPQVLLVTFEDGSEERIDWPAGERWGRWELVRPTRVRSAQLDPARAVLLDGDKLDDGRLREPRRGPATRLALSGGGWLQFLLALVEAL